MLEELFLDRIKLYRMRAGYTQADMAELLGYKSKSGYNNIETGKVKISLQQLENLLRVLNIPKDEANTIFEKLYTQEGFKV